eukprot:CAMPEP_0206064248 /NCGR_PEP_ID=MMETSP1466-20131121/58636_1 /ASSEMBLY_ACC=CAM_ASM_001126 /TAXON_ID=44452 /ORGANISM="Pavlova gyrans, Strain CCMP608" /LENGTH=31 /DNA_ID= /DNA_START= /DNA_END= /DNA_ORIENTATION=
MSSIISVSNLASAPKQSAHIGEQDPDVASTS